jgi:NGP1NT (NUC091) domain.
MAEKQKDPYTVLLKSNKLPMSLIRDGPKLEDGLKKHQAKMTIEREPFSETFGPKAQRKRPKLSFNTVDELAGYSEQSLDSYHARLEEKKLLSGAAGAAALESEAPVEEDFSVATAKEAIFNKGTSKRIWNELCMPISPLLYVNRPLTYHQTRWSIRQTSSCMFWMRATRWARDGMLHTYFPSEVFTNQWLCSRHVEKYLAAEAPHKHLVFVLNKIDLVPSSQAVGPPFFNLDL